MSTYSGSDLNRISVKKTDDSSPVEAVENDNEEKEEGDDK